LFVKSPYASLHTAQSSEREDLKLRYRSETTGFTDSVFTEKKSCFFCY